MERFKAVEKAMKTKAYSKEGLSAAAKLDPKEQAKQEAVDFLAEMVDQLDQQIETVEAEAESIQATMKKGKSQGAKADRLAEIDRVMQRHKWHQGKLELIRRSLENGGVEPEQVNDLEESIRYYVTDGMTEDFIEDDEMYDDLNLDEEEDAYRMGQENEKDSDDDTKSTTDDVPPESEVKPVPPVSKPRTVAEAVTAAPGRRPSAQLKSPLPALATLNTPAAISNGTTNVVPMKPATIPMRPVEGLKYASAAAAAAASDKNTFGISPLPPAPNATPANAGIASLPSVQARTSATSSPATSLVQPVAAREATQAEPKQPSVPVSSTPEAVPPVARAPASATTVVPPAISQATKMETKSRTASKTPAVSEPAELSKGSSAQSHLVCAGLANRVPQHPKLMASQMASSLSKECKMRSLSIICQPLCRTSWNPLK
jgi:CCR4-NOT transcription complex subunit 3